ncbi:MAG: hypothetical protein R3E97_14330 [Candidatus Eisenbacteria bacterium]
MEDFVPDTGGSFDGWGEWFITTVYNAKGFDLTLTGASVCSGPMTEDYGWLVWLGLPGLVAPTGDAYTADFFGQFTPVDPNPDTFPPTVYTYVDVSAANIVVPDGTFFFAFGYDKHRHRRSDELQRRRDLGLVRRTVGSGRQLRPDRDPPGEG